MADGYFVTPQDAEQGEIFAGIYRRTMAMTDEAMLCEFFLQRDSRVPEHNHSNDQIGYIVYGSVELTIGGETCICQPGDSYAIPGGVEHTTHALVDSLIVTVFSPPHADFRTEAR